MTTFTHPALPQEPPLGSIVEDFQGRIWHGVQGSTKGTRIWAPADHHTQAVDWHKLLDLYAPLTLVREGKQT